MSTIFLPAGQSVTVIADAVSYGTIARIGDDGKPGIPQAVGVSSSVVIGPFATPRSYRIDVIEGTLSISIAVIEAATAIPDVDAPAAFTPPTPSGSTPVLSDGAGDLDDVAAALETLRDEVAALTTSHNAALAALRLRGDVAV